MEQIQKRAFVIVPAAGRSLRMGCPKLSLPWRGTTIIEYVLEMWLQSRVERVVVVGRSDDIELARRLSELPIALITPEIDPADMKASIQLGIDYLNRTVNPHDNDVCFVAPADLPKLSSTVIDRLLDVSMSLTSVPPPAVMPYFGDQRGHPALLPWSLLAQVRQLENGQGVNRLVDQHAQHVVQFCHDERIDDIDTMEEYERLMEEDRGRR